jgi:hypothetical protein
VLQPPTADRCFGDTKIDSEKAVSSGHWPVDLAIVDDTLIIEELGYAQPKLGVPGERDSNVREAGNP